MSVLESFPSRVEAWIGVWNVDEEEIKVSEWKYHAGRLPSPHWEPYFCVVMENERVMYLFSSESAAAKYSSPEHLSVSRLDGGVSNFCNSWGCSPEDLFGYVSLSDVAGNSTLGSSTEDSWKRGHDNISDSSLDMNQSSKKKGFLRSRGDFMGRTRSSTKLDRRKTSQTDLSNAPSFSSKRATPTAGGGIVSELKRSLSLGRLSRRRRASRDDISPHQQNGSSETKRSKGGTLPGKRSISTDSLCSPAAFDLRRRWNQQHQHHKPLGGRPERLSVSSGGAQTLVQAVHPSLVAGRRHCFTLTVPAGGGPEVELVTRFFASQTEVERCQWMKCLRRTAKPNMENERHRENSLRLSILEAKNLPSKRRYFCDVCLGRTLYARTACKSVSTGVFWAEEFDLNNLPDVSVITINLYREAEQVKQPKRKKRRHQNKLVGFLPLQVSEICKRTDTQGWFAMQIPGSPVGPGVTAGEPLPIAPSTGQQMAGNDLPQIRIKARFQTIEVLPLQTYWPLKSLVCAHYLDLVSLLEPALGVKTKEELASCLVRLHEKCGSTVVFLTDLVHREMRNLVNDSMTFRANTIATKAFECYLKLVGGTYLYNVLHEPIQRILASPDSWEVNSQKLNSSSMTNSNQGSNILSSTTSLPVSSTSAVATSLLFNNQALLIQHVQAIWTRIFSSLPTFPPELHAVFSSVRSSLQRDRGPEFVDNLISGCIFLRFLVPAILSPSLFNLTHEFPEGERVQRNLTLLAKSIQTLANFTSFGDKEPYMRFLNSFVERETPQMRVFLRTISSGSPGCGVQHGSSSVPLPASVPVPASSSCRDYIDLAYEMALLHQLLAEAFDCLPKESLNSSPLAPLTDILATLNAVLKNQPPPTLCMNTVNASARPATPNNNNSMTTSATGSSGKPDPTTFFLPLQHQHQHHRHHHQHTNHHRSADDDGASPRLGSPIAPAGHQVMPVADYERLEEIWQKRQPGHIHQSVSVSALATNNQQQQQIRRPSAGPLPPPHTGSTTGLHQVSSASSLATPMMTSSMSAAIQTTGRTKQPHQPMQKTPTPSASGQQQYGTTSKSSPVQSQQQLHPKRRQANPATAPRGNNTATRPGPQNLHREPPPVYDEVPDTTPNPDPLPQPLGRHPLAQSVDCLSRVPAPHFHGQTPAAPSSVTPAHHLPVVNRLCAYDPSPIRWPPPNDWKPAAIDQRRRSSLDSNSTGPGTNSQQQPPPSKLTSVAESVVDGNAMTAGAGDMNARQQQWRGDERDSSRSIAPVPPLPAQFAATVPDRRSEEQVCVVQYEAEIRSLRHQLQKRAEQATLRDAQVTRQEQEITELKRMIEQLMLGSAAAAADATNNRGGGSASNGAMFDGGQVVMLEDLDATVARLDTGRGELHSEQARMRQARQEKDRLVRQQGRCLADMDRARVTLLTCLSSSTPVPPGPSSVPAPRSTPGTGGELSSSSSTSTSTSDNSIASSSSSSSIKSDRV